MDTYLWFFLLYISVRPSTMAEFIAFLEQHWVLVSAFGAGALYLTRHLITEQQKTAQVVAGLDAIKALQASEASELSNRIDDYHVKAVAREEKLKQDNRIALDTARMEIDKKIYETEKELRNDLNRVSDKVDRSHDLLLQIAEHNKQAGDQIKDLITARNEATKVSTEFWKEYGALLPGLKKIVNRE